MTIYKSEKGKKEILELYDKQLERLQTAFRNQYVSTSFGETHVIETGNRSGIPLLLFHGGNATTAYNLLACDFLMKDFHIYAVDTIGHPGKSAEVSLSPRNYDYGKWAGEVISALGYENIRCFGGSFGAGIICKTMCVSPEKVKCAVLYVPSGIKNAPAINSLSMMFPMILYWITHKDKWLKRCMLPMAVTEENITDDIFETAKLSIHYSKVKTGMPSDVAGKAMKKCKAPVLVMAAEKDCLFPAKGVLPRAKQIMESATTYLLADRGHMNSLTEEEKQMIVKFLMQEEIHMFQEVSNWLDGVLNQKIPAEVEAFCFNLYEDGDYDWSMELVGTERFDMDDEDWPCDEVTDFGTRVGLFAWKKEAKWDTVLSDVVSVLQEYLEKGNYAKVLKSKAGVGVGFVDGNIEILYKK